MINDNDNHYRHIYDIVNYNDYESVYKFSMCIWRSPNRICLPDVSRVTCSVSLFSVATGISRHSCAEVTPAWPCDPNCREPLGHLTFCEQ